jgi:hypothetical protein
MPRDDRPVVFTEGTLKKGGLNPPPTNYRPPPPQSFTRPAPEATSAAPPPPRPVTQGQN